MTLESQLHPLPQVTTIAKSIPQQLQPCKSLGGEPNWTIDLESCEIIIEGCFETFLKGRRQKVKVWRVESRIQGLKPSGTDLLEDGMKHSIERMESVVETQHQ